MTINPQLLSAYRFHRAALANGKAPPPSANPFKLAAVYSALHRTAPAMMALIHARADVEAGTERYWSRPSNDRANGFWKGHDTDKMQWIERPEAIGLRFVDYADRIDRHIEHEGWFTDDDGGETLRGVVYRLPARNGIPQFVVGFNDPENDGAAAIDFSAIYRGERTDVSDVTECDAARKAARAADKLTETEAEERRDHNRAWYAGTLWAEFGEEINTLRNDARDIIVNNGVPCRDAFAFIWDRLCERRRDRRDLARGDYDGARGYLGFWTGDAELRAAFNDGASQGVLA